MWAEQFPPRDTVHTSTGLSVRLSVCHTRKVDKMVDLDHINIVHNLISKFISQEQLVFQLCCNAGVNSTSNIRINYRVMQSQ